VARIRYVVFAVLLGLGCVLQLLLIVPAALFAFPFVLIAGVRAPRSRDRHMMGPLDPPGNQSPRRKQ